VRGNTKYVQDVKTKHFIKQHSCGATVKLWCYSTAVVQHYICQCVKLQNFSFILLIKINRSSVGAVVSVHAMKAFGVVAGYIHSFLNWPLYGMSGRYHVQPIYLWERSMVHTE
jgi:hypothetical protein